MYAKLKQYIENLQFRISYQRINELTSLADYISGRLNENKIVNLTFICTHNSRRSHLGQIWAATAAAHFYLPNIYTFSGGTEATAFNPRAVAAIMRAGFQVENPGGENPRYLVKYASEAETLICFSKTYDDPFNPQHEFAAIMTCSDADENCPFIPGADLRSPIRYDDPKVADDTQGETAKYDERCQQVASEMFYLMELVKNNVTH